MTIHDQRKHERDTARLTGIWYLALAVSGVLGFMVYHPQVFVIGDPEKTLAAIINAESTARIRLLLEFAIVISQALTAVWFYKLFKDSNEWAAWTLGIWGMINSVMIMISAISMASAIGIAHNAVLIKEDKILLLEMLQSVSTNAWGIGGLFFGLWLLPMGYCIISAKRMPVWLGRILIMGGIGYIVSTVLKYAGVDYPVVEYLTLPATVGEFWMIGYLLLFGIRPVNE